MLKNIDQYVSDLISPYPKQRWMLTAILSLAYIYIVLIKQTHVVITYTAGVYLLQSFILFVTPNDNNIPDPFEPGYEENYTPSNIDNDYKPYVRKLSEYTFWLFTVQVISAVIVLVQFEFTDIPVYTPILATYFAFMLIVTLYTVFTHSKKYKYNLFSFGKSGLKD